MEEFHDALMPLCSHFLLEPLREEFELDLAAFIHDDNQILLSLGATITDTWRVKSRKPLMTAIQELYAGEHRAVAHCMWHPKLKTVLDSFMLSPVMSDWITRNTFAILSTGGTQGVSLPEALRAIAHLLLRWWFGHRSGQLSWKNASSLYSACHSHSNKLPAMSCMVRITPRASPTQPSPICRWATSKSGSPKSQSCGLSYYFVCFCHGRSHFHFRCLPPLYFHLTTRHD